MFLPHDPGMTVLLSDGPDTEPPLAISLSVMALSALLLVLMGAGVIG